MALNSNDTLEQIVASIGQFEAQKDFAAAASACKAAINLAPEETSLLLWLGWIYFNDKLYEKANATALAFIHRSPTETPDGYRLLIFSAAASGAWEQTSYAIKSLQSIDSDLGALTTQEASGAFLDYAYSQLSTKNFANIVRSYDAVPNEFKFLDNANRCEVDLIALQAYIELDKARIGLYNIINRDTVHSDFQKWISKGPLTGVTFITSIMPHRHEVQNRAIKSWLTTGADIISFNIPQEANKLRMIYPDVNFIEVSRDASSRFVKPYVYLSDMMSEATKLDCEILILINSDIIVRAVDDEYLAAIKAEARNSLVFGHRFDVDDISKISDRPVAGSPFVDGYDWFAFSRTNAAHLIKQPFIFGCPWWDLWLPVLASSQKIELCFASDSIAYHEKHEQRWNGEIFETLGLEVVNEICQFGLPSTMSYSARQLAEVAFLFKHKIKDTLPTVRLVGRLASIIKSLIAKEARDLEM